MSLYNSFNKASFAVRSFDDGSPSIAIEHGGAGIGIFAKNDAGPAAAVTADNPFKLGQP